MILGRVLDPRLSGVLFECYLALIHLYIYIRINLFKTLILPTLQVGPWKTLLEIADEHFYGLGAFQLEAWLDL